MTDFGTEPEFAPPAPPVAGINYAELNGALLLILVAGVEDHVPTVHSEPGKKSPAVRATLTVVDGPNAGQVWEDALVFPKVLQGQLNRRVGKMVLGRLGKGTAKAGQSAPWLLSEATPSDMDTAKAFMARGRQQAPATNAGQAPF